MGLRPKLSAIRPGEGQRQGVSHGKHGQRPGRRRRSSGAAQPRRTKAWWPCERRKSPSRCRNWRTRRRGRQNRQGLLHVHRRPRSAALFATFPSPLSCVRTTRAATTNAAGVGEERDAQPEAGQASPPTTGPRTLPIRKAEAYAPETRPRLSGGASLISRPIAATVNITEPAPPRPRKTSSCQ